MLCLLDLLVCFQVVGLYRLCGSAAVKKELREAFERDSHAVELCENAYPDVNVITGEAIGATGTGVNPHKLQIPNSKTTNCFFTQ